MNDFWYHAIKNTLSGLERVGRGPEQIRTAVRAFAELCLATRPQDPIIKYLLDT